VLMVLLVYAVFRRTHVQIPKEEMQIICSWDCTYVSDRVVKDMSLASDEDTFYSPWPWPWPYDSCPWPGGRGL